MATTPKNLPPITRENPTCVVVLVDQSSSMSGPFGKQPEISKAEGVAHQINQLLQNLSLNSARAGGIYGYLHLGLIGFGDTVGSIFGGTLANRELVSISEVAVQPLRIHAETKLVRGIETQVKRPLWIEPKAKGGTPMDEALQLADRWVAGFLRQYPDCFPPIVLLISDGQPTKVNPLDTALALQQQQSTEHPVLLLNLHIAQEKADPIYYPLSEAQLPPGDKFARLLYRMSSPFSERFVAHVKKNGNLTLAPGARGLIYNGDLHSVTQMLNLGSEHNPNK